MPPQQQRVRAGGALLSSLRCADHLVDLGPSGDSFSRLLGEFVQQLEVVDRIFLAPSWRAGRMRRTSLSISTAVWSE
jgi:hypothetical protein